MQPASSSLVLLERLFPGRVAIPVPELAQAIGLAAQTIRNRISDGTFPIPTIKQGAFRYALLTDVAQYLDSLRAQATRPKRGRPTKASQIARRQAASVSTTHAVNGGAS